MGWTGTGTGPGRLWYMRMMLRISLLGCGRSGLQLELCTGGALLGCGHLGAEVELFTAGGPPWAGASSCGGSTSSFFTALVLLCFCGFFTTGGGGGGGDNSARKREDNPTLWARNWGRAAPAAPLPRPTCYFLFILLLFCLLLGDLNLGWRLHRLHLDRLLP